MNRLPIAELSQIYGVFFYVVSMLGAGATFLAARAIAGTWRPWWQLVVYVPILGMVLHLLHWGLFQHLLSRPGQHLTLFLLDTALCALVAVVGFRITRARQMARQYSWLHKAPAKEAQSGAEPASPHANFG